MTNKVDQLFTEKASNERMSSCLTRPENRKTFTVDEEIKFQLLTRALMFPLNFF